ncbi:MAG: LamG domain-containing protein, partial [Planctomycetota bacterium]
AEVARGIIALVNKDEAEVARVTAVADEHPLGKYLVRGPAPPSAPQGEAATEAWERIQKEYRSTRLPVAAEAKLGKNIRDFMRDYGAKLDSSLRRRVVLASMRAKRASGLVAHWTFDEGRGAMACDTSGNDNHGRLQGAEWAKGKLGGALAFDGSSDYVALPTSLVTSSVGTVSAWVNTAKDFTESGHIFYGASQTGGDGNGAQGELHLSFKSDETVYFYINDNGSSDVSIASPSTLTDGAWHHLAASWNIRGNAILYVDGANVAQAPHDADALSLRARICLGRPDLSTRYYSGLLDDVRIYNRALHPMEVRALATAGE